TRARTLRGIAGIADYAPLSDVADAVERTGRALMPDAPLAAAENELFRSAAAVLRRASDELRVGRVSSSQTDEVSRFVRAAAALQSRNATPETVVSIDSLFYADAGPHVVERRTPPVTPEQRFRQEIASRGEHVARLVNDARQARDEASRARVTRDLGDILRDIERLSVSFGAHQTAGFFGESSREANVLSSATLDRLDAGASILRNSDVPAVDDMERRLAMLERARRTPIASPTIADAPAADPRAGTQRSAPPATLYPPPHSSATASPPPAAVTPVIARASAPAAPSSFAPNILSTPAASSTPAVTLVPPSLRKAPATPTGRELHALLNQGIAAFAPLDLTPLVPPAPLDDDVIVPIESLLYRGTAALDRAIVLRDSMRARGMSGDDSLKELFDLLDLARSE
ncbi:MAG: hypothetical protein ABIT38_24195, partial [Gemmatimonadaceae bacterium]